VSRHRALCPPAHGRLQELGQACSRAGGRLRERRRGRQARVDLKVSLSLSPSLSWRWNERPRSGALGETSSAFRRSRWLLDAEVRADRGGWGRRGGAHSSRVHARAAPRSVFGPRGQTDSAAHRVREVRVRLGVGGALRCVWGACAHVCVWRAAAPRAARSSSVCNKISNV
jgi:hypothetical protein